MFSRAIIVLALTAMLVLALGTGSFACVGARPLAMGGAFVGLADDTNATYWNPAGLIQLDSTSFTGMYTTTNRDEINYQHYVGLAMPLMMGKAAAGVSWVRSNMAMGLTETDEQDWYWASLAYQLSPQTSIGVNVKSIENSLEDYETETGVDVALFHRVNEKLTAGLLIQDFNEPELSLSGTPVAVWTRNYRPGFAFRPDALSVVSVELYDAMDDTDSRSLRVGYEKMMSEKLAVRAGYYGLGQSESDAITVGFGIKDFGGASFEYPMTLDIAAMFGDVETILTSLNVKF